MTQLSGLDAMFLRMERSGAPMHVAALGIYDSSTVTAANFRYKDVLRFFAARLDRAPIFRRRLVEVPFGLDRPYWIEDARVDVEYHVRHMALPRPGDWRQLFIQIARIHARPLDRSKPLWEAYVIEGLDQLAGVPPGSFAFYVKMHHAVIDGQGAAAVLEAMHTAQPDEHDAPGDIHVLMRDRTPLPREMYLRAAARPFAGIPRLARAVAGAAPSLLDVGANLLELSQDWRAQGGSALLSQLRAQLSTQMRTSLQRAPHTRFSAPVSPHRVIEVVKLPIADIGVVRAAVAGTTLNDVLVATVGGALHRYLAQKHELPHASLIAQVPISLRLAGAREGRHGNVVSAVLMPIHSEIAESLARLRAVHAGAVQAKSVARRLGVDLLPRLAQWVPGRVAEVIAGKVFTPMMNLVISNVRGSERPLYLAGARAIALIPLSIVVDGVGLNLTANSYAGNVWMSILSCRSMMPDPDFFAECVRASFAELIAAARGSSEREVDTAQGPRQKRARARTAAARPIQRNSRSLVEKRRRS